MKKAPASGSDSAWLDRYIHDQHPSSTAAPAFRQLRSPAERKAEETSRAARAATAAASEQRRIDTARLKAARLAKEAATDGVAAPMASKKPGGGDG
jgi:hypothetical protein